MNWFTRKGILFIPSSPIGWGFVGVALAYCVYAFFEINSSSYATGNTLIAWAFNVLLILAALYGVAWISSGKK
jgi:hypothetical protein